MKTLISIGVAVLLTILFYLTCLNHVGANHIGVAFNGMNGEMSVQTTSGWHVTSPFVRVVQLPTNPRSLHIPSDAKVINTKIVKLNVDKALDFIRLQGFSLGLGNESYFDTVLMGYAFSGQSFSFLSVVQEGGLENAVTTK